MVSPAAGAIFTIFLSGMPELQDFLPLYSHPTKRQEHDCNSHSPRSRLKRCEDSPASKVVENKIEGQVQVQGVAPTGEHLGTEMNLSSAFNTVMEMKSSDARWPEQEGPEASGSSITPKFS
jgi:hypothetical protein